MSKERILEEIYERTNGKFNENEYMKKLDILCSILKTSKPFYSEIEEIEFCQKRFTIKCKVDKYEKIGVDRSKNKAKNTAASLMFKELLSIFQKEGHHIEKDNFIVPLFSLCRELKYPSPHFTIMFEKMHENVQQYSCMCIVGDFVTIAKRSSKIKAKHSAAKRMMYVIRHATTVNKTAQVLSPSVIDQMPKTEGAFLCDIDPPNLVDNTLNMFTYLILFCRKENFPGPILQFDCDNSEENSEKYKISCIVKDIKETAEGESVIFAINLAIKKVLTKLNKYVLEIKLDQEAQLDEKAKRLKKKAKCGKKVNTSSLTIMEDVKIFFINNPFSLNVLKKYNHFKDDPIETVYKLVENTDLKIDFIEKMNGNDDDSCFISIIGKPALTCFNVGVDCKSKAAHDLLSTMKILIS